MNNTNNTNPDPFNGFFETEQAKEKSYVEKVKDLESEQQDKIRKFEEWRDNYKKQNGLH